jgi:energy-coupling factor transporter transmembrane protein EcfT
MELRIKDVIVLLAYLISFSALIFSGSLIIIGSIAALLTLILLAKGEARTVYTVGMFSAVSGVIVFAINEYFAAFQEFHEGGRFSIAVVASLRIFALIAICLSYIRTVDGDITYELCSRFIPRSAILTALSLLLLPRLVRSFEETRHSLIQRGVNRTSRALSRASLRGFSFLVKAALVNAVEESWTIAEALVHRGYTGRRR